MRRFVGKTDLICDLIFEPIVSAAFKRTPTRLCLTGVSGVYWQLSESINGTSAKRNQSRVLAQRLRGLFVCLKGLNYS